MYLLLTTIKLSTLQCLEYIMAYCSLEHLPYANFYDKKLLLFRHCIILLIKRKSIVVNDNRFDGQFRNLPYIYFLNIQSSRTISDMFASCNNKYLHGETSAIILGGKLFILRRFKHNQVQKRTVLIGSKQVLCIVYLHIYIKSSVNLSFCSYKPKIRWNRIKRHGIVFTIF